MTSDAFLDNIRRQGGLVSAGPVQDGWAHPPLSRGKMIAHHWAKTTEPNHAGAYGLRSACGLFTVATPRVPLLGAGNLPFCVRCENRLMAARR